MKNILFVWLLSGVVIGRLDALQRGAVKPSFNGHWVLESPPGASADRALPPMCFRECTMTESGGKLTVNTNGLLRVYTPGGPPVREQITSPYGTSESTTTAVWENATLVITFSVKGSEDRPLLPNVTRISIVGGRLHVENSRPAMGAEMKSSADYHRVEK
jgi:hypothetical protein